MSKFTFKHENDDCLIEHSYNEEYLHNVVMRMEEFLRGCGFIFDGSLEIVENSEKSIEQVIDNMNTVVVSTDSPFSFSEQTTNNHMNKCSVCGIKKDVMIQYSCFDKNCPKGSW
jgi:hypothetical protein